MLDDLAILCILLITTFRILDSDRQWVVPWPQDFQIILIVQLCSSEHKYACTTTTDTVDYT